MKLNLILLISTLKLSKDVVKGQDIVFFGGGEDEEDKVEEEISVDQRITQGSTNPCVPLSKCPALLKLADSNPAGLLEVEKCGPKERHFVCPLDEDVPQVEDGPCECVTIDECEALMALAVKKDFVALDKHSCEGQWKGNKPLFCCPGPRFQPKTTTLPPKKRSNIPKPEHVDIRVDLEQNGRVMTTEKAPNSDKGKENGKTESPENNLKCGIANTFKIFGGVAASDHEFPMAAALTYINPENGKRLYSCGGVLISDTYVLTAAHCIIDNGGYLLRKVTLGHANLESTSVFEVDIAGAHIHPDYERTSRLQRNDLAILKLKFPVVINNSVNPICLPEKPAEKNDLDLLTVIGWGLVNRTSSTNELQKLVINRVGNAECVKKFRSKIPWFNLVKSQMCAQGPLGADSCRGDSGGPLIGLAPDSTWHLIGITSFGTVKCDSSFPGVYTNVFEHLKWIKSIINR